MITNERNREYAASYDQLRVDYTNLPVECPCLNVANYDL